jgi:hypothetical protein
MVMIIGSIYFHTHDLIIQKDENLPWKVPFALPVSQYIDSVAQKISKRKDVSSTV